jgi:hypothetical protein
MKDLVCIEAPATAAKGCEPVLPLIKVGEYYTHDGTATNKRGLPRIGLVEFPDYWFHSYLFRPLTFGEQETEIVLEHFRKVDEKERERSPKPKKQTV